MAHADPGTCETLRMFLAALARSAGPVTGGALSGPRAPLPFTASAGFATTLCTVFRAMRPGYGGLIRRGRSRPA